MSIYADKKNGQPTGRWRVELQRKGFKTYKKRWDTYAEAKADEAAVLASWEAGDAVAGPGQAKGAPEVHTLSKCIELARGLLWDGQDTEDLCFQRLGIAAGLMGRDTRLDDIDTHKVDDLVKKLRKEGRADGTINRYLCHLHVFLLWCRARKYRTAPVDGEDGISFAWKKESKGRIRWITLEEQELIKAYLLGRTHESGGAAKHVWDLIHIAIETGCRREELLSVKLDQINGDLLHLWKTKTDEARTIPMRPEIRDKLVRLVKTGNMPTDRGLRSWWQRVRESMGLLGDPDFVFHACRHTCATRMVDADVNIFVIQEWMGHKVIETTRRYAHVKPQNLNDALRKVGERMSIAAQNPEVSEVLGAPHLSPTGGVSPPLAAAA